MSGQRFCISRGGADEPGLLLILDTVEGTVVARSSELGRAALEEFVALANVAHVARLAKMMAAIHQTDAFRPDAAEYAARWAHATIQCVAISPAPSGYELVVMTRSGRPVSDIAVRQAREAVIAASPVTVAIEVCTGSVIRGL
jgi:hypothetical protein